MRGFYVYMLACSDGSLYTGYTVDIMHRLAQHRGGRGSKYVASRLPVVLAYLESAPSRKKAMQRECEIKRMRREGKLRLCQAQGENRGPDPRRPPATVGPPRRR